ncbi:DNA-binding response regulator [Paenibacillaceae bacterium]|nr:DNA-binding response regulator [Paenibacillaceae bacterium]
MRSTGCCKVLIVDDEVLIRQGIKHFMDWEQEGFQIVGEASNGQEALERIEELKPHIVLTDIVMPVMDGEELTKEIKARYPDIEVIVLSSFGEFDYVRSTFQSGVADYILKPKLDMQHLLAVLRLTAKRIPELQTPQGEGVRSLSIEWLLESLLNGFETNARVEEGKSYFPYPHFRLVGAGDRGAIERLSELPQAVQMPLPKPQQGGNVAAWIINGDVAVMSHLLRMLKNSASDSPGPVAVSPVFNRLEELPSIYRDSLLKLLHYAFYLPDIDVLVMDELPQAGPIPEPFPLNKFTEAFKWGQFSEAFEKLRRHVSAMAACYTLDVFEFKSFLGNLIFNMTVLLGNMDYNAKQLEVSKYAYFKQIEQSSSAGEALERLEAFIAEAEQCIASKAADPSNENMKKLLQYIQHHYAEPLTLTDMAKHFHFNPSYLSSYFSTHNEEGFVDYLHKVRIGKAEELLQKGDAPISEISGLVGYSDHSYFCKVFKKSTGLSPSQYRRQYRSGGK